MMEAPPFCGSVCTMSWVRRQMGAASAAPANMVAARTAMHKVLIITSSNAPPGIFRSNYPYASASGVLLGARRLNLREFAQHADLTRAQNAKRLGIFTDRVPGIADPPDK